jgi:hypothetical protein
VLGFVGAPFTLATYIVEGGSSKNFAAIKRMAFAEPAVLHALLDKLADNVADYVRYQVASASHLHVAGSELVWGELITPGGARICTVLLLMACQLGLWR